MLTRGNDSEVELLLVGVKRSVAPPAQSIGQPPEAHGGLSAPQGQQK